jgi:C-terminal processing protease CtpA/Prc
MKKNKASILLLWFAALLITFTQCRKEAVPPVIDDTVVTPPVTQVPAASEVNTFVWSGMHDVYLWNDKIPSLTNSYYQPLTTTSPNYKRNLDSLNTFLNKYSDPSKLFNDLLYQYKVVDKWSFIVNDYAIIQNWIAGISKTMGYDFHLYYLNKTSADIFGVVRYVLKGSPADLAGIKRGDIFNLVDGVQLTAANYQANLINKEAFTLSFATIVNGAFSPATKTASLTAVQMQEDPVLLNKIITVNGSKIGYLVYNGFTSDFDLELNTVFQQFKEAGVSKLILDLRYNGGGSVQTAIYLASMIYSTNTSKVFSKSVWNSLYASNNSSDSFTDKIYTSATATTPINTLNLTDIYFIVSQETASASELLINGLIPYMNVKVIGTNTYGKYVASATIYDYAVDSNGQLIKDNKGNYVPVTSHKYAMQPIIAKYANSLGVSDFVNGLAPNIKYREDSTLTDIVTMRQLGDESETMLKLALDNIKGLKTASVGSSFPISRRIESSIGKVPFVYDMYIDPQKLEKRTK